MNKLSIQKILLIVYAFIAGALFGFAFAFIIVIPIFRFVLYMFTGNDAGPNWTIHFINISFIVSIIGGIYISEKWCLSYLSRRDTRK